MLESEGFGRQPEIRPTEIICLQENVRYSFPDVAFTVTDEDGEESMQSICLSWPEGNHPIDFLGTDCIVLQRTLIFEDAPGVTETFFLCNCRCGNGKEGLILQEEMERVISHQNHQSTYGGATT